MIVGLTVIGAGGNTLDVVSASTTQVVFASTNSADTRTFAFDVVGTPTGYAGVPTSETLYEDQPQWLLVPGTPGTPAAAPPTPDGYEAFAAIAVAPNATVLDATDITILFPTLPVLGPLVPGPNGSLTLAAGVTIKWGSVPVRMDTNTPVNFVGAFPNAAWHVFPSIDVGIGPSPSALSVERNTLQQFGFNVVVKGGDPAATVNVSYFAIGI
jgi:hypothetical protein